MAQAVPELTPGEFRGLCFEAARRVGGEVTHWFEPGVTPNYHAVFISYRDRRPSAAVLRTARGDVALTVSDAELAPLEFVDDAALTAVLAELSGDLRLWAKTELDQPFQAGEWPDLDPRDVRYWRPERVGDALFNHWD